MRDGARRRRTTAAKANAVPRSARLAGSGMTAGASPFAANPDRAAPLVVLHPGWAQAKARTAAKYPALSGVSTPAAVDHGAPVSVSVKLIEVAASWNPSVLLRLRSNFPKLETLPGTFASKLAPNPVIVLVSVTGPRV